MNTTEIIEAMKALTAEERLEIMSHFCSHCGCLTEDRICWCSNDD